MPSTARRNIISQSLLYHVFNRGNNRAEIFHTPDDYQKFLKIISQYARDNNLRVYHWAVMSNHYHLVVELDEPAGLSAIMAGVARSYVHYYHKTYHSAGHLWQGRFKSQPMQKELYLVACGRYIERNPVKAGLAGRAEDYLYSSAAHYVFGRDDGLTTDDPLFETTFGADIGQRRQKYEEFLTSFDNEEEDERVFGNLEFPRGTKEFLRRLVKERGLFLPRRRGGPRRKKAVV